MTGLRFKLEQVSALSWNSYGQKRWKCFYMICRWTWFVQRGHDPGSAMTLANRSDPVCPRYVFATHSSPKKSQLDSLEAGKELFTTGERWWPVKRNIVPGTCPAQSTDVRHDKDRPGPDSWCGVDSCTVGLWDGAQHTQRHASCSENHPQHRTWEREGGVFKLLSSIRSSCKHGVLWYKTSYF